MIKVIRVVKVLIAFKKKWSLQFPTMEGASLGSRVVVKRKMLHGNLKPGGNPGKKQASTNFYLQKLANRTQSLSQGHDESQPGSHPLSVARTGSQRRVSTGQFNSVLPEAIEEIEDDYPEPIENAFEVLSARSNAQQVCTLILNCLYHKYILFLAYRLVRCWHQATWLVQDQGEPHLKLTFNPHQDINQFQKVRYGHVDSPFAYYYIIRVIIQYMYII